MAVPPRLLDALRGVVGARNVRTDPEVVAGNVVDWTNRFRGTTPAVVAPGSAEEVAGVLRLCDDAQVAIVPQGGNTGLVGGSVPLHGEIVLYLGRLDVLEPVDVAAGQVTAQAGVTIARIQDHARAAGWRYAVDLASRSAATVGGTIATNAGGLHVLRFGPTRRQLVGVEAVFADGTVVRRLDGLEKDNTGYDLAGLLCGSEGTLAIVTAARLRLVARATHRVTALVAFASVNAALDGVGPLRRTVDGLEAIEFFVEEGLDLVCDQLELPRPFARRHAAYLLVEAAAQADPTDAVADAVHALADVADVAVASDARAAEALWRYREGHTEAINLLGGVDGAPHKLDVTLPQAHLATFVATVAARVTAVVPGAHVWLFGHAGDGNVHVNVTGVGPHDERVDDVVFRYVASLGGSISAEHGIGTAKRAYLGLVRTDAEIRTMRTVKHALDPRGILNPNVLLPS